MVPIEGTEVDLSKIDSDSYTLAVESAMAGKYLSSEHFM